MKPDSLHLTRVPSNDPAINRRTFLRDLALSGGALVLAGRAGQAWAEIAPAWKNHIGLELYTVRNLLREDYEGTLAKLAKIGYCEVEPADPYDKLPPAEYKTLLDRYGMKMFSTHSGASDGPGLEKQLEGFQLMGIQYTEVHSARGPGERGRPGPRPPGGAQTAGGPAGAARGPGRRPEHTVESVKASCAELNKYGAIVKKFGMKILVHNHAGEFDFLEDGKTTQYDLLLAETDPALVAMQLDIGWAYVAGQDAPALFKRNPGRFELWHVKDAKYKELDPNQTPSQRMRRAKIVALGEGDIDYKTIFDLAGLAGLRHFAIEQDTAGQGGRDAIEDCRISYEHLRKILA